ncbi:hypothetical protein N7491_008819 [Penicillium cf. griseofulvum]|nr:hypothetical protein N7491_008819 [Penicillium cf. griseofulvum]
MFGGPPSKGKKITCPTRGQASPALRPQNPYLRYISAMSITS